MNTTIKLNKKSLLPICAENAPQFSNDVYNKRYTSEKITSRFKQNGRSMIEMLGVLAIIGVLTVGSITGYSRAMHQHKLNQTKEIIAEGINNYKIFLLEHPNELEPLFKSNATRDLGIFVDTFVKPQNFNNVSPLDGSLKFVITGGQNNFRLMVSIWNLLTEDCINLIDWAMLNLPLRQAMVNNLNKGYNTPTCYDEEGNYHCRSIVQGTKAQIAAMCQGERNYLLLDIKRSIAD